MLVTDATANLSSMAHVSGRLAWWGEVYQN